MLLTSIARSLQVAITGTTPSANLAAGWKDTDQRNGKVSYDQAEVAISSSTSATEIVPAPGEGVLRDVEWMSIYNIDGTTTTASVLLAGGDITTPVIFKAALATVETAAYTKQRGWHCVTTAGALKTTPHA